MFALQWKLRILVIRSVDFFNTFKFSWMIKYYIVLCTSRARYLLTLKTRAGVLGSHPPTHFILLNLKLTNDKFYIFCQKWWTSYFWPLKKKIATLIFGILQSVAEGKQTFFLGLRVIHWIIMLDSSQCQVAIACMNTFYILLASRGWTLIFMLVADSENRCIERKYGFQFQCLRLQ